METNTPTKTFIDFQTEPSRYRHWKLSFDGPIATLAMDVDPQGGLFEGYELKLNSYDLGVDIELYDAIQRLRFEHPEVRVVIFTSAKDRVFCAGANIRMLAQSTHAHKVNFCKFTNETRLSIEDACENSGQHYLCAIHGTAAGGGYELALTADRIIMADDGNTAVSLPELPLLAVLPGTGGLTRVVDKRKVRRDLADVFSTTEEGVKGKRAVEWGLVDEVVPSSKFKDAVRQRAQEMVAQSDRPPDAKGIKLTPLQRSIASDTIEYDYVKIRLDRKIRTAWFTLQGPSGPPPDAIDAGWWLLALARQFDDAMLHLRLNEPTITSWVFKSKGDREWTAAFDATLGRDGWLYREIRLYWKRVLKRLEVSSRSLLTLIEPGSNFVGCLFEVALASDRALMLDGPREGQKEEAAIRLTPTNFGTLPMGNGLSRMESRFWGHPQQVEAARKLVGQDLAAADAAKAGLVTATPDDIDWEDEVRLTLESRASFSSDALTGMEANLRFVGPETMETKIFGRLSAWQNWIFQRPNAVGEGGALKLYGSGKRAEYHEERV
ncbi:MAG TPA: 2,3-epoxybenzoyl-CoA dihydrolase [Candidatus Xenobia bacterium]|jgi:benzoyl-CoA-dihydrodiol lyase